MHRLKYLETAVSPLLAAGTRKSVSSILTALGDSARIYLAETRGENWEVGHRWKLHITTVTSSRSVQICDVVKGCPPGKDYTAVNPIWSRACAGEEVTAVLAGKVSGLPSYEPTYYIGVVPLQLRPFSAVVYLLHRSERSWFKSEKSLYSNIDISEASGKAVNVDRREFDGYSMTEKLLISWLHALRGKFQLSKAIQLIWQKKTNDRAIVVMFVQRH
ncbi:hypothetical protein ARMSODRAFT_979403 [Armillaria solidipes]|uniref:Uncharacterized protein n=1 Tax=Armillaria solidipes TaxID=1076256 RepID=A0A2H3BJH3_9AGAR|nr:hypothetical protein ARMSODRAFT_979403 [Armillaria solidipes]